MEYLRPAPLEKAAELTSNLHGSNRISISSKKVWCYSCRIEAKRRRIRIGTYPAISLAEARSAVREIQRDIELGTFEKVS